MSCVFYQLPLSTRTETVCFQGTHISVRSLKMEIFCRHREKLVSFDKFCVKNAYTGEILVNDAWDIPLNSLMLVVICPPLIDQYGFTPDLNTKILRNFWLKYPRFTEDPNVRNQDINEWRLNRSWYINNKNISYIEKIMLNIKFFLFFELSDCANLIEEFNCEQSMENFFSDIYFLSVCDIQLQSHRK